MRNARAARYRIGIIKRFHLANLALGTHATDFAAIGNGHARGVVTAIFKGFQARNEDGRDITLRYSGDDSTHGF